MDVLIGAGGKFLLEAPQQVWRSKDEEDSLFVAVFAGKPMMIMEGGEDEQSGFELYYLDFKSTKFSTKEAAKLAAPAFARAVLEHMIGLI